MKNIIFKLQTDDSVMGLPRMLFVLTFGCILVLCVGFCAMFIAFLQQRKKDKKYYSFSLLSQRPEGRKLFEDDDDVDETELFRTPIKSKIFCSILINNFMILFFIFIEVQPYYDDERDPIVDTDELDSEEEIIMINKPNTYEYHD